MEFTGERVIPGAPEKWDDLYAEHVLRYAFARLLAPGRRVLDDGCGCGYGSFLLARAGAAEVVGIDRDPEAVAWARGKFRLSNLRFEVMDTTDLRIPDGRFDVVACFELIEHVDDYRAHLREVRRVLAPSGRYVVSTPNARLDSPLAPAERPANPFHVQEWPVEDFRGVLGEFFPALRLYAQHRSEGFLIRPLEDGGPRVMDLPVALWRDSGPLVPEIDPARLTEEAQVDYVVAVCAASAEALTEAPGDGLFLVRATNVLREREGWVRWLQDEKNRLCDRLARLEIELNRAGVASEEKIT